MKTLISVLIALICFVGRGATWHGVVNSDSSFTFVDTRIIETNGVTHYLAIYRVGEIDVGDVSSKCLINIWYDSTVAALVWVVSPNAIDLSVPIPSLSDAWLLVESSTPFSQAIWETQNVDPSTPYRHLENWDWPNYINGITVMNYTEGCDVWADFDSSGLPRITECFSPLSKKGFAKGHNKQPLPTPK